MRSSDSCTPDVSAAAVNECPAPIALTRVPASAARRTIAATSSVERGTARSAATHRWFPAQFDDRRQLGHRRGSRAYALARDRPRTRWACRSAEPPDRIHGTCHHDCPDSCGWTVDRRGRGRGQAARARRPPVQRRRAVPEGQPLPRPRVQPRPDPAPAASRRAEGRRASSSRSRGTTRSPRSPTACTPSSTPTGRRRSCPTATPATRACCR